MQHLENDMDELFQRAAENYPLDTGKGDWENIAKRIADKFDEPAAAMVSKNNAVKKITALFLLLFIGMIGWFVFQNNKQQISSMPNGNVLSDNPEKIRIKISTPDSRKESQVSAKAQIVTTQKNKTNYSSSIQANSNAPLQGAGTTRELANAADKNFINAKKNYNDLNVKLNNYFPPEEGVTQKTAGANSFEKKNVEEAVSLKNKNNDEELSVAKNASAVTSIKEKHKNASLPIIQRKKGLYIGIVAGPDFSKVYSGSFGHPGFDAGLLAGYRLNKKISFESGITWNKKYYTSEGKNFRMDKVASTMPLGMIINDLESNSSFVEIPLKVKFDFLQKKNTGFFVAAGVSAYIITKEQNMYHVTYNGDNKNLLSVYEKNNYGLPAVINLSTGYEKNIFKTVDVRIEPYLKIPLRGMGVGSLPVTSAGLQIGIIRRLK